MTGKREKVETRGEGNYNAKDIYLSLSSQLGKISWAKT